MMRFCSENNSLGHNSLKSLLMGKQTLNSLFHYRTVWGDFLLLSKKSTLFPPTLFRSISKCCSVRLQICIASFCSFFFINSSYWFILSFLFEYLGWEVINICIVLICVIFITSDSFGGNFTMFWPMCLSLNVLLIHGDSFLLFFVCWVFVCCVSWSFLHT